MDTRESDSLTRRTIHGSVDNSQQAFKQDREETPHPARFDARSTHRLAGPISSTPYSTGNSDTSEGTSSHLINRMSEILSTHLSTRPPGPAPAPKEACLVPTRSVPHSRALRGPVSRG
jgi:hypothetical protein